MNFWVDYPSHYNIVNWSEHSIGTVTNGFMLTRHVNVCLAWHTEIDSIEVTLQYTFADGNKKWVYLWVYTTLESIKIIFHLLLYLSYPVLN